MYFLYFVLLEVGLYHPIQLEKILGNFLKLIVFEVKDGVQLFQLCEASRNRLKFVPVQVQISKLGAVADRPCQYIEDI